MENRIKVGSVVFHKHPQNATFQGPGIVLGIEHDADLGVDMAKVLWQGSLAEFQHAVHSLKTQTEAPNVG